MEREVPVVESRPMEKAAVRVSTTTESIACGERTPSTHGDFAKAIVNTMPFCVIER
jgi:hypothetical protein